MATKKKAAKKKAAKKNAKSISVINRAVLKFNPKWFTDPGPDGWGLNPRVVSQINQLKAQFAKQFNSIIAKG
jgi:hypothetical protein